MFRRVTLSVIILASFVPAAVAQDGPSYKELPNFHQVSAGLYRGAQPRDGGIQRLARLGFRTVINLRDDDERARAEGREVREAGMLYFNVPLSSFAQPTDEQVNLILEIAAAPESRPVFIHCKHGADRTGTVIAIYRITREGWTSERAREEANRYGMHWTQFEMRGYITDYYRRHTGEAVKEHWHAQAAERSAAVVRRGVEESPSLMRKGLGRLRGFLP